MNDDLFTIRTATEHDVPLIFGFIKGLAAYQKLSHEVAATQAGLRRALFGAKPAAEVVIAFSSGEPVGFALFFQNFSTFMGKPGLYLEDLFVGPEWRGRGFGRRLLIHLARLAVERDYGRMEWSVLDWNEQALGVYRRIGATPLNGVTVQRLTGEALRQLASQD